MTISFLVFITLLGVLVAQLVFIILMASLSLKMENLPPARLDYQENFEACARELYKCQQ